MKKRPLSIALVAVLLIGLSAQAATLSAFSDSPASSAGQGDARVYVFAEAAIQFRVPAGWSVRLDSDGNAKVSAKTGDAQIAFVALPIATDLKPDEREGLLDTLAEKARSADLKLGTYNDSVSLGGMKVGIRRYIGNEIQGSYALLSAEKFVFIVVAVKKAAGDTLDDDVGAIMKSIKRSS